MKEMKYILDNITSDIINEMDEFFYLINGGDIYNEKEELLFSWSTNSPNNIVSVLKKAKEDIVYSNFNFEKLYVMFTYKIIFSKKIDSILKIGSFKKEHSNWLFSIDDFEIIDCLVNEDLLIIGGELYDVNYEYIWPLGVSNDITRNRKLNKSLTLIAADEIKKQVINYSKNIDVRYYSLVVKEM